MATRKEQVRNMVKRILAIWGKIGTHIIIRLGVRKEDIRHTIISMEKRRIKTLAGMRKKNA
jgi:hypothetical protein